MEWRCRRWSISVGSAPAISSPRCRAAATGSSASFDSASRTAADCLPQRGRTSRRTFTISSATSLLTRRTTADNSAWSRDSWGGGCRRRWWAACGSGRGFPRGREGRRGGVEGSRSRRRGPEQVHSQKLIHGIRSWSVVSLSGARPRRRPAASPGAERREARGARRASRRAETRHLLPVPGHLPLAGPPASTVCESRQRRYRCCRLRRALSLRTGICHVRDTDRSHGDGTHAVDPRRCQ